MYRLKLRVASGSGFFFNQGKFWTGSMQSSWFQIVPEYLKQNLFHQVLIFLSQISWAHAGQEPQNIYKKCQNSYKSFLPNPANSSTRHKTCNSRRFFVFVSNLMSLSLYSPRNAQLTVNTLEQYLYENLGMVRITCIRSDICSSNIFD